MTALCSVLQNHWGAVGRDLLTVGLHFHDLCTEKLSLAEFAWFVLNAPPNTAVYHQLTEGWDVGDRLLAHILDAEHDLLWAQTKDAHKDPPRNRPKRTRQPGMPEEENPDEIRPVMTVSEYLTRIAEGR